MVAIPENKQTLLWKINEALVEEQDDGLRHHLGGSLIGQACARQLWYSFRWVSVTQHAAQLLRLFERGQLEEERFERWLKLAEIEFYALNATTNKQYRVQAVQGHFGGSLDGIGANVPEAPKTPHLFEFKTHGDKSFKELKKKGMRTSKPEHYGQMQVYMHLKELTRGVYMAINKNTDELYVERVRYDKEHAEILLDKAETIIASDRPPKPISKNRTQLICRWCDYAAICKGDAPVRKSCRTCKHAKPVDGGLWHCAHYDIAVNENEKEHYKNGCEDFYEVLEDLKVK